MNFKHKRAAILFCIFVTLTLVSCTNADIGQTEIFNTSQLEDSTQSPSPTLTETSFPTKTLTPTPTATFTITPTFTPTRLPESDDLTVAGYYIGNWMPGKSTLEVFDTRVVNYEVTEQGITLELSLHLYNQNIITVVETEGFVYLKVDSKTLDTLTQFDINKDFNIGSVINDQKIFNIILTMKDHDYISRDDVEKYINGELEAQFDVYCITEGL